MSNGETNKNHMQNFKLDLPEYQYPAYKKSKTRALYKGIQEELYKGIQEELLFSSIRKIDS